MSAKPAAVSRYNVRIPSLFEIFFGRLATWFRQLRQWRKQGLLRKALQAARRRHAMRLETLEPRVLLSADPVAALDFGQADDGASFEQTVVLDTLDVLDDAAVPAEPGDVADLDRSNSAEPDLTGVETEPEINAGADITLTLDAANEAIFGAQTIYLAFDGAQDVDYEGPIVVADIDLAPFMAPDSLEGQEADIIASTLGALDALLGDYGLTFTTEQPLAGDYSTLYFGGDSEAIFDGRLLYGLSEHIDAGNADRNDIAFVFTDNLFAAGRNAVEYGGLLAGYAAHELGHLLGYEHAHEHGAEGDPLAEVAFDPKVHVEIGKEARADAIDNGKVTINGVEYDVHPKLVAALTDYEPFYNAGAVGGDAFPDVVMGQFAIHPVDHGTWLTRVLDMAWEAQENPWFTADEKGEILAWSYGLLTHSAGDHFAHTLVNEFAEGVAPGFFAAGESIPTDQRDLGNMLRHFMTEAYMADALQGVDRNPDITQLPDGDWSDNSTPGIDFNAPIRFIYEALIRPFEHDPTPIVEMDWSEGTLAIQDGNKFVRSEGKWGPSGSLNPFAEGDGFKVGHKITVSGFANAANNGTFIVTGVTDTHLTVDATLVNEQASGDEKVRVFVPFTEKTAITVNDATNSFVRTTGSFKDDGFVEGQRFAVYGLHNYHGDYLVKSVSEDGKTLTVHQDLNSGYEVGTGDEQLVVQGSRGGVLDGIFALRDALEMKAIESGPRQDFGLLLVQWANAQLGLGNVAAPSNDQLLGAYLYNWVDDINTGVEHWAEVGLAFSKAMWDTQSKRDVQNLVGDEVEPAIADGPNNGDVDPNTTADDARREAEAGVTVVDVFFHELDDPNNDGNRDDGFINNYLLPMIGLPDFSGEVREALSDVADFLKDLVAPIVEPIEAFFLPLETAINDAQDAIKDFLTEQIEERFGVSVEVLEFLTELSTKMDLASIGIDELGVTIPIFKPGDHEKLDGLLGLVDDHHEDPPVGLDVISGYVFDFYTPTEGRLSDAAHFDKTTFAAYANSVTLTKMLYLMETPPDGESVGAGQLSELFLDLAQETDPALMEYDFTLLNMHGAHGGNVLTTTLPGDAGDAS